MVWLNGREKLCVCACVCVCVCACACTCVYVGGRKGVTYAGQWVSIVDGVSPSSQSDTNTVIRLAEYSVCLYVSASLQLDCVCVVSKCL